MSLEDWRELAAKLDLLPGGAQAAIPDFFGALLDQQPAAAVKDECWRFREGGELWLQTDGQLVHSLLELQVPIASCPPDLLRAAHEVGVSPLLLALLAIAVGQLDDGRRLKQALPKVDGAAKDLMLMTVCRLCG